MIAFLVNKGSVRKGQAMARKTKENEEHKYMFKRGNTWWVSIRRKGQQPLIQSTDKTDVDEARTERDRILMPYALKDDKERAAAAYSRVVTIDEQIKNNKDAQPSISISDGWGSYISQPNRPDTGGSTLEMYQLQYEAFAKWIASKHPEVKELRHVTTEHATVYAGHLLKTLSHSTFNKHMNLLALVWRVLKVPAKINVNPWDADHITRKKFIARSRRELTIAEINRIMNTATGEMQILLALGLYCGLRLGDAACLQWNNVDMARRIISLIPMKTARKQKRVTIPIHATLYNFLDTIPASKRKGAVLPTMQERYKNNDDLSKGITRLFLACDIKTNANRLTKSERKTAEENHELVKTPAKRTGKQVAPECGFHSLRHSFVSLCAAGRVPQSVVQSLVGHGSPAMTQHYTHIGLETAQNAIATLPSLTGKEVIEEKNDAKLEDLKKQMTGLTDNGLEDLLKATKLEISTRKKAKKNEPIDVEEIPKSAKAS